MAGLERAEVGNIARNHHFIPQCYLNGFVRHVKKPRVFVVDFRHRTTFTTHPRNVGAERDFHAVDLDGHSPDALEGQLAKFEDVVAPALQRVDADRAIRSNEDQSVILNLIALLAVKVPRFRRTVLDFEEQLIDQVGRLVTSNDKIWKSTHERMRADGYEPDGDVTREEARDFLKRGEYSITMRAGYHVALELKLFEAILPTVVKRAWKLLRVPRGELGFVTSDNPVCLNWSDPGNKGPYPPGFGLPGTDVLFPISNSLAWLGSFDGKTDTIDLTEDQIAGVNGAIIHSGDRQIYGRDGDCIYRTAPGEKHRRLRELLNEKRFAAYPERKTKMRVAKARLHKD